MAASAWLLSVLLAACGRSMVAPDLVDDRITVDGHDVWLHVAGTGPVCLVQPGGPGVEWTYLRMPDVERFVRLVYIEPVGTGRSGRLASPDNYSYERYAADLDAVRAHLGIDRICVLGHSHGGLVAQTYALTRPEHLAALILYGTTPALDDTWRQETQRNLEGWFGDRAWFADARAGMDAFWVARTDDEATRAFQRWAPLLFADWDGARGHLGWLRKVRVWAGPARYAGPPFDATRDLGKIAVPTLVITGQRDYAMSPATAARIQRGIPGAELVVLEHSGHMAHLEEPRAFAQAIAAFAPRIHTLGAR